MRFLNSKTWALIIVSTMVVTSAPGIAQPPGMALIPGGEFQMGDHHGDGESDELPIHTVHVDSFYMDIYEVTSQQYCDYLNSAYSQELIEVDGGIVYSTGGSDPYCSTSDVNLTSRIHWDGGTFTITAGKEDHPIVWVSWYGAAAYANWRSAQEGRDPCYNVSTWECDFDTNGYRLPTEAEWEYAARGGEHDPYYRYPWGDTLEGSQANYRDSGDPYEGDHPDTTPVGYYDGSQTPPGDDMANGYGLYDMAGNANEWCNDWYAADYYSFSPYDNPRGSPSGTDRLRRGGSWLFPVSWLRCASRAPAFPDFHSGREGFRLVLKDPCGTVTEIIDETGDGNEGILNGAMGVAVDGVGNVYVAGQSSGNVFRITPRGEIIQIHSDDCWGPADVAVDGADNVYVSCSGNHKVVRITPADDIRVIIDQTGDGVNGLLSPWGIDVDCAFNVYVAGTGSHNAFKVIPPYGWQNATEIIDASGDGEGNLLDSPYDIAADCAGNACVTGGYSHNAFKIIPPYGAENATEIIDATSDETNILDEPVGCGFDSAGNVYVAGHMSDNAFQITPEGAITQILDSTGDGAGNPFAGGAFLELDMHDNVYVVGNHSFNAFKIAPPYSPEDVTEIIDATGDGAGNTFLSPVHIAVNASGTSVYVTGEGSHNAFRITLCPDAPVGPPAPEPGPPSCSVPADCTGAYEGADCVDGTCYVPKNRYLSIDPTTNAFGVAFEVEIVEAMDYPTAEGMTWWVDVPVCYDYPNGNPVLPPPETCDEGPDRFGWVSTLTDAPVSRVWTESPLHITGCPVVPIVTYAIWASADEGQSYSDPLVINTIHAPDIPQCWGDVTGGPEPVDPRSGNWLPPEGVMNMADIQACIRTFKNITSDTGFPPRVWCDVEANQVINMADIQFLVQAFEGKCYADLPDLDFIGWHPADCPAAPGDGPGLR